MIQKTQYLIGGLFAAILVAGGIFYVYRDLSPFSGTVGSGVMAPSPSIAGDSTGEAAVTKLPLSGGGAILPPAPSLDRPIVFSASFSVEAQELMRVKIAELTAILKADSSDFAAWMNLGIRRKQVEDYEGARQAWEYASALQPENNIAYHNLGILFHYHLKDYAKAEQNFKISLQKNTTYPQTYSELHDLYRYSYKQNTTAAVDILKQGLIATNNNNNLLVTLARYYRDVKEDTANARLYFTQAYDAAVAAGDTKLVDTLNAEMSALK